MKNDKILFLIPPYFNFEDYCRDDKTIIIPPFTSPYGVLSLIAYLESKFPTIQFSIFDFNVHFKAQLENKSPEYGVENFSDLIKGEIAAFSPTIVAFSALFNISFVYLEKFSSLVKVTKPETLVLAGGGLPSSAYREVLELCPSVDAICKGEGEIPMADLLNATNREDLLNTHPSWINRSGLSAGKLPQHTFVNNLDDIPMFNYAFINLDNYNQRSIDKRYTNTPKREMSIHTSRGCPFSCVFCANPSLHGKKVRSMSVERVIAEVKKMKDYGMTVLLIEDDHFFFDISRAKEILRGISELDVRIEFPNGVAVYAIDDEVATLLKMSGTSTVALAVESGSDYVLKKIINKPLNTRIVKDKVEVLRKHGVQIHAFIVIGLPGEMDVHRDQTLTLLLEAGFDWVHIFCAVPIFGSRLFDICIEKGYIKNTNFFEHVTNKCVMEAPGVDPESIEKTAYDMNLNVNFVNNYNLKKGNCETAVKYFSNVARKYPDHAFAHYFLSLALNKCGSKKSAKQHLHLYQKIISGDHWWRVHAEKYNLPLAPIAGEFNDG